MLLMTLLIIVIVAYAFWRSRSAPATVNANNSNQSNSSGNANTQTKGTSDSTSQPSSPGAETAGDNGDAGNTNEEAAGAKPTLTISVSQDGVSLSVDSRTLPPLAKYASTSINLAPGQHVIRAFKPGYKLWESAINLNPKEKVTLPIELESSSTATTETATAPSGPSAQEQAAVFRRNADQYLNEGKLDRALSEVDQGLALDPNNPSLMSIRSRIVEAQRILSRQNGSQSTGAAQQINNEQPRTTTTASSNRELKVIRKPSTICPENIRAAMKCGTVFVEVMVSEQGTVYSAKAISGPKELYLSALSAARQTIFQPALRNGQPISSQVKVPFMFNPR